MSLHISKKIPKVGIDAVTIKRVKKIISSGNLHAMKKLFMDSEIEYSSSFKKSDVHFAGTYAAKEAVSKALGTTLFPVISIEICHTKEGAPYACQNGTALPVSISITHTNDIAIAIAIG